MKYDLAQLLSKASTSTSFHVGRYTGCAGKHSFGIVNSRSNGKRVTLSKSLSSALNLADTAEFVALPDDGILMVSKSFPEGLAVPQKLSGEANEKRICYNSTLVKAITDDFHLDFSKHVSCSFSDISIEDHDGTAVAIIQMNTSVPVQNSTDGESA